MVWLSWNIPLLQWCGWVGTFVSSNGAAQLEPSSPPMVQWSWNLPSQWCGYQSCTHLPLEENPHFLSHLSFFFLGATVDPASQWSGHPLSHASFPFSSFSLPFSLFLSLPSPVSCQKISFSNGPLLSFSLCMIFLFLLHRCGCSLKSVSLLLPWTWPHTPSMYMLKSFLSTCQNQLWKFVFSFIRKMSLSPISAQI